MRQRSKCSLAGILSGCGLVIILGGVGSTAAQPATPAGTPDVPAASECTVEALDPMNLLSLAQGGNSDRNLLEATPVPESSLPGGPPANAEEIAGITANVRQLVACANARDPLRLVALLTDDFKLALAGAALGVQGEDAQAIADRFPVPIVTDDLAAVDQISMIPIRDARLLRDGRVGAILEPEVAGVDQMLRFFITFELVEDQWLIDDVAVLEPAGSGTPGA